jgi:hypothetical protein
MENQELDAKHEEELAVVEALKLQDTAEVAITTLETTIDGIKSGDNNFATEPSSAIRMWLYEVRKSTRIVEERYQSKDAEAVDPIVIVETINHRATNVSNAVGMMLEDGDLLLLLDSKNYDDFQNGVLSPEIVRKTITERLERTAASVRVSTYMAKSFLLMSEVNSVDIAEVSSTLANFTKMHFSSSLSPTEAEVINSPIFNPFWVAAIDEIFWNAMKYGATKMHVWQDGESYCFGNDGIALAADQVEKVNIGGTRLYENIEGTGKGIKLIRSMGFDYSLRPATQEEKDAYDVNTVARIKPLAAV